MRPAADADHGDPSLMPRSDPGRGVRESDRLLGLNAQAATGGEQQIRGRPSPQALRANDIGVDAFLDQRRQPGELQQPSTDRAIAPASRPQDASAISRNTIQRCR